MKKNWFKNCDLLHTPMSLSYKNEYFYTSNIGAILTILCFLIIVIFGTYEIKVLVDKSSFTLITNHYIDLSQAIDFETRPLLFQLIDNTGEFMEMDEKLFEFIAYDMEWSVEVKNGTKDNKVINTKLEMETCDKVLLNNTDYFTEFNLSRFLCIKSGQNITTYGYLGDMANGYKGFRIYLNKCNNKKRECYDENYIITKLQNIKFRVMYLGFNINIFKLGNTIVKYQMFSKACSVSTNLLKKFYFTFSIGKFQLYNNIFHKKKIELEYIIGNEPIMDIDLDPKSTISKNSDTLAYFSFNFDGNIVEISKEVKRFFDTFSIIGNAFNILLTLFKIINNYYSNKILFVDIFKSIFFKSDNNNNIHIKKFSQKNFLRNINKNNENLVNNSKKNALDLSDVIGLNNNKNNFNNISLKNPNNKIVINSEKNKGKKRVSQIPTIYTFNREKFTLNKIIYYYLFPLWLLKKHKTFENICFIKDKICSYFSVEKFNELIIFIENFETRVKKLKVSNTELIKLNKKYQDSSDSNDARKNNRNS